MLGGKKKSITIIVSTKNTAQRGARRSLIVFTQLMEYEVHKDCEGDKQSYAQ